MLSQLLTEIYQLVGVRETTQQASQDKLNICPNIIVVFVGCQYILTELLLGD